MCLLDMRGGGARRAALRPRQGRRSPQPDTPM